MAPVCLYTIAIFLNVNSRWCLVMAVGVGLGWAVTGRGGEGCIKIKDRNRISYW